MFCSVCSVPVEKCERTPRGFFLQPCGHLVPHPIYPEPKKEEILKPELWAPTQKPVTLRQYYAAKALIGLINGEESVDAKMVAEDAFRLADAMIAFEANEKKNETK